MTEAESSKYPLSPSSSSSLPPPQYENPESCMRSFINQVTNCGLRFKDFLCHLIPHDISQVLQNVICYGTTEGRDNNGIQNDAEIRQKTPLFNSNEEPNKPQDTTDFDASSVTGSVNDDLQILLPQDLFTDFYDPCSMPCGEQIYHEAPTKDAFELVFPPQSFFTNFPSDPASLPPIYGGFDFEVLTTDFKQYELWGGPQGINNNQGDANTIDGSFYKISRNPFDPIGRPCNPYGPIGQPLRPFLPSSYELREFGFV